MIKEHKYRVLTRIEKIIPVYHPLKKTRTKSVKDIYHEQALEKLDPLGWRRRLIHGSREETLFAGDVVRVVYTTRAIPQFLGQIIGINRKKTDSSILLRNMVTKIGVEMRVKIFSPLIQRIDLVKRPLKKLPRNKHYYIRHTRHEVKDLEAQVKRERKKMRQF